MTTQSDGNGGTWMLFSSRNAMRVNAVLHQNDLPDHNISSVKDFDWAMNDAARRGCNAALKWFQGRGGPDRTYSVSFDMPDKSSGERLTGASGGLAFAVAVARKVRKAHKVRDDALGAVAAVGVVKSGDDGGPVGCVGDIEAKIEGALEDLPAGGHLIYPQDNKEEIEKITPALWKELAEKNIKMLAVESVDDALNSLFPPVLPKRPRKAWGLLLIAAVCLVFASLYKPGSVRPPVEPPTVGVEVVTAEPDESAGVESDAPPTVGSEGAGSDSGDKAALPAVEHEAASSPVGDGVARPPSPLQAESMAASSPGPAGAPEFGGVETVCCRRFPDALLDKVAVVLSAAPGVSRVERKPAPLGAPPCFSIEHTTTAAALSEWLRHNLRTADHREFHVVRDGASGAIELVFDGGFD